MNIGALMISMAIIALMFNNMEIVMKVVLFIVNLIMLALGVGMFYLLITWFMS